MKTKSSLSLLVAVVAVITLAACNQAGGAPEAAGRLTLNLGEAMASQSIVVPGPIPTEITGYRVLITQGSTTYFDQVLVPQGTINIDLPPGPGYTVTVEGQNTLGDTLARGVATGVAILPNQATSVSITVAELTGDGYIDIVVSWDPAEIAPPITVESQYRRPESGSTWSNSSPQWLVDPAAGTASFDSTWRMPNGWWLLTFELYSNGDPDNQVAGEVFLVRVVKDYATAAAFTLEPNELTGGLNIVITEDVYGLLEMSSDLESGRYPLVFGSSQAITVSSPTAGVSYAWFVNGSEVATGESFSFDTATLQIGDSHRVSAIGYTADGKLANGISWIFDVTAE